MTLFKRKLYQEMLEWKQRSNGNTALVIEGARRVGKTTICETFATNEYGAWVRIDFSEADKDINGLFSDLSDLDRLYRGLQLYTGVNFIERDTLIIFDEIQNFNRAREAIKHLVKDGRYDFIETGSLISMKKNVRDIVIPSEEEHLELHPLDFEEFLWACGNNTLQLLKYNFEQREPLHDPVHNAMMRDYREYIAVGGMPQAVEAFVNGSSYLDIDRIKRTLIKLYMDDFAKIDPSGMLGEYFRMIPSELSRESRRYRLTDSNPGKNMSGESQSFSEMRESKTVQLCYHANDPRIGMSGALDPSFFKMFLEDTGLFVTLCFYDNKISDNIIYEKLVKGRLPANLGYVYENAVSQALVSSGHMPRYHTFPKTDGKHFYEVDFLVSKGLKVIPIEVKSSTEKSHVSLDKFLRKHSKDVDCAYVVCTKNIFVDGRITYIPIYMAGFI